MATFDTVVGLLAVLNQEVTAINAADDYDSGTVPAVRLMIQACQAGDFGRGQPFVDSISDALFLILEAHEPTSIRRGFRQFDLAVDQYRHYLAVHWWQFGADPKRSPLETVPKVSLLSM